MAVCQASLKGIHGKSSAHSKWSANVGDDYKSYDLWRHFHFCACKKKVKVYIGVHACMYVPVCMLYLCAHISVWCMCGFVYVRALVCTKSACVFTYVCMHVCTCVYALWGACTCTCACIGVHASVHTCVFLLEKGTSAGEGGCADAAGARGS